MNTSRSPNTALQAVRMGMRLSQDELAQRLRSAGQRIGDPNDANKRLVQRWEAGAIVSPRPMYARALEMVTGLPIEALGFPVRVTEDSHGGHDVALDPAGIAPATIVHARSEIRGGTYAGVWLSRYEYYSSNRNETLHSQHYVLLLQHGDQLTVRNLHSTGSSSSLAMDLTVDGSVITGTWVERTQVDGFYRGARYHGAIQMLAEPTGRRIVGKWVGFGKEMAVNTGPWELIFQDSSTSKATLERYAKTPDE